MDVSSATAVDTGARHTIRHDVHMPIAIDITCCTPVCREVDGIRCLNPDNRDRWIRQIDYLWQIGATSDHNDASRESPPIQGTTVPGDADEDVVIPISVNIPADGSPRPWRRR